VHPSSLAFGGATLLELCLSASRRAKVPIGVHLDHAHDEKDIRVRNYLEEFCL
jgi:fructose/tagatose bisphosphate aldolase